MQYQGLSPAEVEESWKKYGANVLEPPPKESAWRLFLGKFRDPVILVLILAASVSILTGGLVESAGILLAILLSTGIGFLSEYRAGQAFDLLNRTEDARPVKTARAGKTVLCPRSELVRGDVVFVETGEEIPADAEVLSSVRLHVDQSKFTGEPEPVPKVAANDPAFATLGEATYPHNRLLRGSSVLEGNAWLRITAVGSETEIGRTARAAAEITGTVTPLQKQLIRLGKWIAAVGISLSALLFVILIVAAFLHGRLPAEWSALLHPEPLRLLLGFLMIAITLIVVTVPEGLPMSVTLSLACNMRRMAKSNCLVRTLHAGETIGAATVICTDKTGTLTMNRMRVSSLHFPGADDALVEEAFAVNSTADLNGGEVIGNPTEGALLRVLAERGTNYRVRREAFTAVEQIPFDTERKYMSTRSEWRTHYKGAPEIVLGMCAAAMAEDGPRPLTEPVREALLAAFRAEQAKGCRTLGFAVREAGGGIVFLGFAAISDPVRPDVPDAVLACRRAGVKVKIVTGDTRVTADEIGRQIGLGDDAGLLLEGRDFEALSESETLEAVKNLRIIARARPQDKLKLVKALQKNGEVVAVTGDGTNDAPALHYADVGISMGKTGTAIAREASDIILLDDSFRSIVNAVLWGRSLYLNIQRFLIFQLTINVAAAGIALLGPFLGIDMPFTVIQMLWINLIMDTFAALALATEPPTPKVMEAPPRRPDAFIVTRAMGWNILLSALVFIGLFIVTAVLYRHDGEITLRELTILFNGFVLLQFWNLLNVRAFGLGRPLLRKLPHNPVFFWIVFGILAGQVLITQFGGAVFRTVPLGFSDWLWIAAATSPIFWLGEAIRLISSRYKNEIYNKSVESPISH